MSVKYKAGLDDSGAGMAFAVLDESGKIVFDEFIPVTGRTTANLPKRMADVLVEHQLDFTSIKEWSVGAGPGSFTGLRIASVFVMGLAFGREDVRTRCVSTASMIAASAATTAKKILVLFDGRKRELLAFGTNRTDAGCKEDGFQSVIRTAEDLAQAMKNYDCCVAFGGDYDAAAAVLGDSAASVMRVERISARHLIDYDPEDFSRPLTDLTYLRPAVFVEPKVLRQI